MSTAISSMITLTGSVNNVNSVIPIVNTELSPSSIQNRKIKVSTHNFFFSNNVSSTSPATYNNFFGDGSGGTVTVSSSTQVTNSFTTNLYGDPIVREYGSLTVNAGTILRPTRACRGLIIYCTGDLTVNGTITMTNRGAGIANSSSELRYDLIDASIYVNNMSSSAWGIPSHWNWAPSGSFWFNNYKIRIPLSGSVGGAGGGGCISQGGTGTAGIFTGGGGGGGGGGSFCTVAGGTGGRGTIFCGGGGGGGAGGGTTPGAAGGSGNFEIGGTGAAPAPFGAGGAGIPFGVTGGGTANPGTSGTGGLIVLIVKGNVTIGASGAITSQGSNGGNIGSPANFGGAGGGSGGGRIIILYGGTYTNSGTVSVSGGTGGISNVPAPFSPTAANGGNGGAGSLTIRKIHT
jgi:hypothetical protein